MAKKTQRFNKSKPESTISKVLSEKKTIASETHENFKVSFQYIDTSQKFGSSFKDWQKVGLLSKTMDVLKGYCCSSLMEQVDGKKFTIYGDFPPKDRTKFKKPVHIPEDARWARIHINGPTVIAGHVVKDTFYVVFLDKTHKFYLTRRVTGK